MCFYWTGISAATKVERSKLREDEPDLAESNPSGTLGCTLHSPHRPSQGILHQAAKETRKAQKSLSEEHRLGLELTGLPLLP